MNVWDHSHSELVKRIDDCIRLDEAYQSQYWKMKEKLQKTPSERQFDFRFVLLLCIQLRQQQYKSSSVMCFVCRLRTITDALTDKTNVTIISRR